jgi:hypothetical protein
VLSRNVPLRHSVLTVSEVQVSAPAEDVSAVVSKRNEHKRIHSFKQLFTLNTDNTTNCSFSGSLLLGVDIPVKTLKKEKGINAPSSPGWRFVN